MEPGRHGSHGDRLPEPCRRRAGRAGAGGGPEGEGYALARTVPASGGRGESAGHPPFRAPAAYARETSTPYLRFILKNSANREAGPRRLGFALMLLYLWISSGAISPGNLNTMPDVMCIPAPL